MPPDWVTRRVLRGVAKSRRQTDRALNGHAPRLSRRPCPRERDDPSNARLFRTRPHDEWNDLGGQSELVENAHHLRHAEIEVGIEDAGEQPRGEKDVFRRRIPLLPAAKTVE